MNFKKTLPIFQYAAWLLKKYNKLKQDQEHNIYRIVEIKQPSLGEFKLIVQVIGKSTIIECNPKEILINDRMLEGFSKKDIRTIAYFACEQNKKPKYKIIMQDFCEKVNRMVFKLKEIKSNLLLIKTADQIVMIRISLII